MDKGLIYIDYQKWISPGYRFTSFLILIFCQHLDNMIVFMVFFFGVENPSFFYGLMILACVFYIFMKVIIFDWRYYMSRIKFIIKLIQLFIWSNNFLSTIILIYFRVSKKEIPLFLRSFLGESSLEKLFLFIMLQMLVRPQKLFMSLGLFLEFRSHCGAQRSMRWFQ